MNKDKLKAVVDALDGVNYLEWEKLKTAIDKKFDSVSKQIMKQTTLSATDTESIKWLYEDVS